MIIKAETLLILGAGASYPYNFPLGSELQGYIAGLSDGHTSIWPKLREYFPEARLRGFVSRFREASMSIDSFLGINAGTFDDIGKMAIASYICAMESSDNFYNTSQRASLSHREPDHWYELLWKHIRSDVYDPADLAKNKLTIVTFNYDRSLEEFLHRAVQAAWNLTNDNAIQALGWLKVIHVYGCVGEHLSERHSGVRYPNQRQYRSENDAETIFEASKCIRVIPDARKKDWDELPTVTAALEAAQQICFLGFGYDPDNIEILGCLDTLSARRRSPKPGRPNPIIVMSRIGIEDPEIDHAMDLIGVNSSTYDIRQFPGANNSMTLRKSGILL